MPTFLVLRCFQCENFQVQQAKKDHKFKCSICGTKQSEQRIYSQSAKAADCRRVCQSYNRAKGELDLEPEEQPDAPQVLPQANDTTLGDEYQREKVNWLAWADAEEDDTAGCTIALPNEPSPAAGARAAKRPRKAGTEQQGSPQHLPPFQSHQPQPVGFQGLERKEPLPGCTPYTTVNQRKEVDPPVNCLGGTISSTLNQMENAAYTNLNLQPGVGTISPSKPQPQSYQQLQNTHYGRANPETGGGSWKQEKSTTKPPYQVHPAPHHGPADVVQEQVVTKWGNYLDNDDMY